MLDFGEALREMVTIAPATAEPAGKTRARGSLDLTGLAASDPWLARLALVAACLAAGGIAAGRVAVPASTVELGCKDCLSAASFNVTESGRWAAAAAAAARVPSLSELLDLFRICEKTSQRCEA